LLPPSLVLLACRNDFDAASSESLNAWKGCPELCAAERGVAVGREIISRMAFAITPSYWHVAGQTFLASRPLELAALLFRINTLTYHHPALPAP
jgi:hypothetical protein